MDITHKISLDLQKTGARQVMFAKQGDCLTRIARLLLYDGGTEFTVPSGTITQIAYAKQDGKGGVYDTMPDGSAACTMSGNVVTAKLHPQMFSVAGIVACELRLLTGSGAQLSTFSWFITVQASAAEGIVSEDYFRFASLDGLRSDVGDLSNLSTSAKDNLVAAINEVAGNADNAATAAQNAQQTADNAATAAGNAATAAATAQQTADQAATAAGNAATAAQNAKQTADNAATAAGNAATAAATAKQTADAANSMAEKAATELNITRNSTGGYTATWKENGTDKSAKIVGGVGLAKVANITGHDSETGLPYVYKTDLVGPPSNTVLTGDLIVYTGNDYYGLVGSVTKKVASKNEVFRVTGTSIGGIRYFIERTGLILETGFVDRREEWLAWLVAQNPDQTSDADVSRDEVFRFLSSLPDGLHYLDNTACWGKFWAVNQSGKCVVFAPPDIYIVNTPTNILKLTGSGTLEKYTNADGSPAKSVDLLNSVPPKTTAADALKIWAVGVDGTPAWTAVPNAEEVAV